MRILIIRHGEPNYSIDSLTEKGWREAEFLSTRLADTKIDAIYCSPLGRARDTAKATLEKKGMTSKILPWLAEWRGRMPQPYGEKNQTWPWDFPPSVWANDDRFFDRDKWCEADIINTTNSKEIYEETKKGIDDLLASYGYKRDGMIYKCDDNRDITIAFFCHFALGSVLLGYLTGIAPSALWHTFFMPTSSVTTLVSSEMTKGVISFRCMQLGDTSHLYANGEPVSGAGLMPEIYDGDK